MLATTMPTSSTHTAPRSTRQKHAGTTLLSSTSSLSNKKPDQALPDDPTLHRVFRGHRGAVLALAFRPNLAQVASASADHAVLVWNFKPGLRAFRYLGHTAAVTAVEYATSPGRASSGGSHLLVSASLDRTVRLWTPTARAEVAGTRNGSTGGKGGAVHVIAASSAAVRAATVSPDGATLASAGDDKCIKLWTLPTARFSATLAGHANWVRTVAWAPDAQMLVSGSDDKSVRIWDPRAGGGGSATGGAAAARRGSGPGGACVKVYSGAAVGGPVDKVAWHPAGALVAAASADGAVRLWDLRMHRLVQCYPDAHQQTPSPAHAAHKVASGGNGAVRSVAFGGARGEWMMTTGTDGLVKVWDVVEGHLVYSLHGHERGATTAAVFAPGNSGMLATGGEDAQVFVWKWGMMAAGPEIGDDGFASRDPVYSNSEPPVNVAAPLFAETKNFGALAGADQRRFMGSASPPPAAHRPYASSLSLPPQPSRSPPPPSSARRMGTAAAAATSNRGGGGNKDHQYTHTTHPLEAHAAGSAPPDLAVTLATIVAQLDVLTSSVRMLDHRLAACEARVVTSSSYSSPSSNPQVE
ncbi:WD40-repeat-containing domain protein [Blastocladiella britannica]|nr:WD40-repeat-containing domain protein [Blastocladiella britannica]